jgi:hypothetical protein
LGTFIARVDAVVADNNFRQISEFVKELRIVTQVFVELHTVHVSPYNILKKD